MYRFSQKYFCCVTASSSSSVFTDVLDFDGDSASAAVRPQFQLLNEQGVRTSSLLPKGYTKETAQKMLTTMIRQNVLDTILPEAQRQGRISFYMSSFCEEAICVGSAAAIADTDMIYAQYREPSSLFYRGYTITEFIAQAMGSVDDLGRGRNMPMHVGSVPLCYQTVSSPLATQMPQASGVGYGYRVEGLDRICLCYFGEGAASEGDFHVALNMAATLRSQTIFLCRNNGYAISTPASEQYKGDGIVSRGVGYGIPAIRVDGSDILAVMYATEIARERCVRDHTPILIEAMSYRGGHHSTSDDSTRYRSIDELTERTRKSNPIERFTTLMISDGWWSVDQTQKVRSDTKTELLRILAEQEKLPKHSHAIMLQDVYDTLPESLKKQQEDVERHAVKYAEKINKAH